MTSQAEKAIHATAWHYRGPEFSIGGLTYAFVRPMTGRKADHLMVEYPEGGHATVKELWKDWEGKYKVGGEYMSKAEIITRFGLSSDSPAEPTSRLVGKSFVPVHSSFDRVSSTLRELHKGSGGSEFLATRRQIAEAAGVSLPSVSAAVKKLSDAGVVTSKGTLQGLVIRVTGVL